jgi:electron transfer flavoprotein alpha subunit
MKEMRAMEEQETIQQIGPLRMVVCIKQVPLVAAMRFDTETHRLIREGVPLEINELDVYALSEAIRMREVYGGEVIVITMGPPQAREALATALAMGADRALHLNDRAFGGADTAATARALVLAIQQQFPAHQQPVDLIFCGRNSVDAETGQVGPEMAEMLNLPQISAVQKIAIEIHDGKRELIATRETDEGNETLAYPLPVLITTVERMNEGIWPTEQEIRTASEGAGERIQTLTAADLHIDLNLLGQKGSPTWVTTVEADTYARSGRVITESDPHKIIELLLADLETHGLLDEPGDQSPHHIQGPSAAPHRQGAAVAGKAVWVIAEHTQEGIRRITLELLGKGNELAAQLQGELAVVLLGGPGVTEHAQTLAAYGAERIYVAKDSALADYTTEGYTEVVATAIQRYQPAVVLLGSTANGRDLAPRIAARLKLGLTGDCIDLDIDEQQRLVQHKPAFGGSIISFILSNTTPAMATLRPGTLSAATPDSSRKPVLEQLPVAGIADHIHVRRLGSEHYDTGVAALEAAHTILGVGIGMGTPEQYAPAHELATLLQAAIGATRNVTDKGWLPKQQQIGLTGRAVSPRLYIALGVRGAAEHIAGIRKAHYVVSINKNRRAAIFKHSDLGVIGDVHVLLPLFIEALKKRKK